LPNHFSELTAPFAIKQTVDILLPYVLPYLWVIHLISSYISEGKDTKIKLSKEINRRFLQKSKEIICPFLQKSKEIIV